MPSREIHDSWLAVTLGDELAKKMGEGTRESDR